MSMEAIDRPNSILIMQRKPKMVRAFAQMAAAVWARDSEVDRGFKRLIAHVASRAAGCQYCMAHTIALSSTCSPWAEVRVLSRSIVA